MALQNYCFSSLVLQAALLTVILAAPQFRISNSESSRQSSPHVLSCTSSDETTKAICTAVLNKVISELEKSRIGIQKDGVLFRYENKTSTPIDTGHKCTRTAKVSGQYLSAHFLSSASISFSGLSLTEPIALVLNLPVSLKAQYDVEQSFAAENPGSIEKCEHLHGDKFKLYGETSSPAQLVLGFYLGVSLGNLPSGDYLVRLVPSTIVMFNIKPTNIDFHTSGVDPVTGVLAAALGLTSSGLKAVEHVFQGEYFGAQKGFRKGLAEDADNSFILGMGHLPRQLELAVWSALLSVGSRKIERRRSGVVESVETKLNEELHRALRLDSSGVRSVVVKKNILELTKRGAALNDILHDLPPPPPVKCDRELPDYCKDCPDNCSFGCAAFIGQCNTAAALLADDSRRPRNVRYPNPLINQ